MKIMKFTDFVSNEGLNENYTFINEDETSAENVMEYTVMKDGFTFDFTDLYVKYLNK